MKRKRKPPTDRERIVAMAVNYATTRMALTRIGTDQRENWIVGHLHAAMEIAYRAGRRDARKGRRR